MEANLPVNNTNQGPSGLGGWLVIVQIGLYFAIIGTIFEIIMYIIPVFTTDTWSALTSKSSEHFHQLWGPLLIFEAIYGYAFVVFCIYVLVKLYKRSKLFPRLMIILYSVTLVLDIVTVALFFQIPGILEQDGADFARDLFISVLRCAIWIPYFLVSKRVKNTFIR